MQTNNQNKQIIGRVEKIDIPTFDLSDIDAKIDTGAYSGALHVSFVEEFEKDNNIFIRFIVLDESHPEFNNIPHETSDFQKKLIKNSTGQSEIRYVVPVKIKIKDIEIETKLSLSDRTEMKYPVLLGRKVIRKHFLVDPSKKFI